MKLLYQCVGKNIQVQIILDEMWPKKQQKQPFPLHNTFSNFDSAILHLSVPQNSFTRVTDIERPLIYTNLKILQ